MNRREENHQKWEDEQAAEAIRAKARHALDLRLQREAERANARLALRTRQQERQARGRQRNNRREY